MLELLIQNWDQFCKEDNFVGIGSTRKVYKVSDYVIKVHLHPIGYKQSVNELKIYTSMQKKSLDALLAQTYYVDNYISIQKYYTPLELKNNQSYEINRLWYDEKFVRKKVISFVPQSGAVVNNRK